LGCAQEQGNQALHDLSKQQHEMNNITEDMKATDLRILFYREFYKL
jgi:hypothetical protein